MCWWTQPFPFSVLIMYVSFSRCDRFARQRQKVRWDTREFAPTAVITRDLRPKQNYPFAKAAIAAVSKNLNVSIHTVTVPVSSYQMYQTQAFASAYLLTDRQTGFRVHTFIHREYGNYRVEMTTALSVFFFIIAKCRVFVGGFNG